MIVLLVGQIDADPRGERWTALLPNPSRAMQQLHAGGRGLVPTLLTSSHCNTCTRGGTELWLQSLCSCHSTLKQKKKLVTRASTTIDVSWLGTVEAFNHLVK